jgi:1-acyl-sn-glycerol-3-phosphate acyltransferase
LLGTATGGLLAKQAGAGSWPIALVVVTVACLGYAVSRGIPESPATDPGLKINWNPCTETWRIISFARGSRTVFLSIIGISWFWLFGAIYLTQLPGFTRDVLHGNEGVVTLLLALFSVGVGTGSLLCERLSDHRVELGLVPFGAIGLTLFGIDFFFAAPPAVPAEIVTGMDFLRMSGAWRIATDIVLLGVFGGFYIVPLYALIQQRSKRSHLSRIIAANNIFNAMFMVLAAVVSIGLLSAGLSIRQLLLMTALMNGIVAIYIFSLVPEFLLRFVTWILINTIYRIRGEGLEQIPERGPAVLVCNHVSFMDALIIGGCIRRPVRFVMYYKIFQIPVLRFLFRAAGAIPIAGKNENPELLEQALDSVAKSLDAGKLVCIFPEGRISADGELNEFKSGFERIVQRTPVPVIPMALRGLWGSLFSRKKGGRSLRNAPWLLWQKIWLVVGKPVPPGEATAQRLGNQVADLGGGFE